MAARWRTEKLLKIKKAQRAALKSYPYRVDSSKSVQYDIFNNRARVSAKSFMQDIPDTFSLEAKNPEAFQDPETGEWVPKGLVVSPRKVVLGNKARELELEGAGLFYVWQSRRRQGIADYHAVVLKKTEKILLTMYFAGNQFLFVQESATTRFISMTYEGRASAMAAFHSKSISWEYDEPINQSS